MAAGRILLFEYTTSLDWTGLNFIDATLHHTTPLHSTLLQFMKIWPHEGFPYNNDDDDDDNNNNDNGNNNDNDNDKDNDNDNVNDLEKQACCAGCRRRPFPMKLHQ